MTNDERFKWLNRCVQGDDFVTFTEEDGGVIMFFGTTGVTQHSTVGDSVEDCIDAANLYPLPE